ncbi:uncharacterized protein LOC111352886 [Spodoptera litura]|uniref:Uncharacterized protein LOC111352886 n=1 Tax=Spodoptera litura TaxID=69820 RepID=A0A9J7E4G7_SPOLT|nr:uncharacterized protein LOC111352886 [Spodoptera litura]
MSLSPNNKFHSDTDLHKTDCSELNTISRKRRHPASEWSEAIAELSREFKNTLSDWRRDLESSVKGIADNVLSIKSDLAALTQVTSEIKNDIQYLRSEQSVMKQRITELDTKYDDLAREIDDLKNSVQFLGNDQSDLSKKVGECSERMRESTNTHHTVVELVSKIDYLEQTARSCNIEICNVPERRNEDLMSLMTNIGTSIKFSIKPSDIISVKRVPHAVQNNNKPKNIVAKFTSCILRDNILSASRLHKGLNTQQCGISGTSVPIYMHEHLTLKRKKLFRDCREAARIHNYRFLWVKNGTILAREREGAKSFAIRSYQDIARIRSGSEIKQVAADPAN